MLKLLDIEDDLSLFGMLKENHNILAVTENGKRVKEGCFDNVQSFVSCTSNLLKLHLKPSLSNQWSFVRDFFCISCH